MIYQQGGPGGSPTVIEYEQSDRATWGRWLNGDNDWDCVDAEGFACTRRSGKLHFEKAMELYDRATEFVLPERSVLRGVGVQRLVETAMVAAIAYAALAGFDVGEVVTIPAGATIGAADGQPIALPADRLEPSAAHRLLICDFVTELIAERPVQGRGLE